MNRSIAAVATLWLALAGGAWGQGVPGQGNLVPNQAPASPTGPLAFTPEQVFNISDYGAQCNFGATDDTAAVNAAISAMRTSPAYVNGTGSPVKLVGPANTFATSCGITNVNLTGFTNGSQTNPRPRVLIENISFLCSGAGNIGLDTTGSNLLSFQDVSLTGRTGSQCEIGLQRSTQSGSTSGISADFRLHIGGSWGLAAYYNFGSESNICTGCLFENLNTTIGPIGNIGAITAGSGGTPGTYTAVPLTGSATGSGALATIVVNGDGTVHAGGVTITYEGRDYVASDTLSASSGNIGGTTGFSVALSSINPHVVILDGQNHWRATSPNVSITPAVETGVTMTVNSFIGGSMRQNGGGTDALWLANIVDLQLVNTFLNSATSSGNCVTLFDNGNGGGGGFNGNAAIDLNIGCEGSTMRSEVFLTGGNNTPTISGLRVKTYFPQPGTSLFYEDTNLTAITVPNLILDINGTRTTPLPTFNNAKIWTASGSVALPTAAHWNAPASWQGAIRYGTKATPPAMGPLDIKGSAAAAYSCARRLGQSYTGPLCSVTNATATADMYPDTNGDLDRTAYQALCNGLTCTTVKYYDQSGNGVDSNQTTAVSQPTLVLSSTNLNGRPTTTYGDVTAIAQPVTAAAAINNIWAAGGFFSTAFYKNTAPTGADRYAFKTQWDLRTTAGNSNLVFVVSFSTSAGTWTTSTGAVASAPHIVDLSYNAANVANVPTISLDGTSLSLTTGGGSSVQPVGTVSTDAGSNLIIGNNAATLGNRGFDRDISEMIFWKSVPDAVTLEAIRRNQAAYYGVPLVQ